MKKLLLLCIGLISSTLNNGMITNKIKIENGTVTKMFLISYPEHVAYEFVEQETNKTTRIVYDSRIYTGIIRHNKSYSEILQDRATMKAAFKTFEAQFYANLDKGKVERCLYL
jgi:hypothetical protein